MATRSTIALEYADGTVDQVYCHWDGYIEHNGQILFKNYQDPFKVQELMNLGDISSLRPEIGVEHPFSKFEAEGNYDEALYENMTTFYGRDRGEENTGAKRFADFADYQANHQYEEYEYILRQDGNWYVSQYGKGYGLLSDAIENEVIEQLIAEDA